MVERVNYGPRSSLKMQYRRVGAEQTGHFDVDITSPVMQGRQKMWPQKVADTLSRGGGLRQTLHTKGNRLPSPDGVTDVANECEDCSCIAGAASSRLRDGGLRRRSA